jgi:hypothetical protein
MSHEKSIRLSSLNDSFAHVKRELAATQYRNEMMDFMWSAFRKVAGINNRKGNQDDNANEKTTMNALGSMTGVVSDAPLARPDADSF